MYEPREDSFLLQKAVKGIGVKRALDIGTGSGIIAKELMKNCGHVLATDIEDVKVEGIDFVKSDLFENVKGKFDLITWNPPYLPGNEFPELDCGNGGIILKFFREAKKHLNPGGKIMVVLSSLTPVGESEIGAMGYRTRVVAREKLDFEELRVVEAESKR